MQRALRASELTGPQVKPVSSTVHQKVAAPYEVENTKKDLSTSEAPPKRDTSMTDTIQKKESSTPSSPQKIQPTSKTQSTKSEVDKVSENGKQASPTPGQKIPLEIQKTSSSPKTPDQTSQPGAKHATPATQQESGGLFGFSGTKTVPDASKTTESVTGKMFGFGSSIFSSASTLITSTVNDESRTTPPGSRKMSATAQVSPKTAAKISPKSTPSASPKIPPAKETKPLDSQKPPQDQKPEQIKKPEQPQQAKGRSPVQPSVDKAPSQPPMEVAASTGAPKADQSICPLCKVELNMGSKDAPNFNTCTACKTTVCNQCGFNPMPNVGEVSQLIPM